jgi:D-alanyl-D-alanine carboxypeptidase
MLDMQWRKPAFRDLPLFIPNPAYYPKSTKSLPSPALTGESAIVIDVDSFVVLYQKEPNLRLSPASTTKIMTAIVALINYKLSDIATIKSIDQNGAQMGLKIGQKESIENLLYGMLLPSGNDAAAVLAANFPGGEGKFVEAMNTKAEELNMKNTHFTNATGLEDKNHYSTSLDLARLAAYALKNPVFAKIVATPEITLVDGEGKPQKTLKNLNQLLGHVLGATGIKTGWTEDAGECLVASAQRNSHTVITVILRSQDRFGEGEKLLNWAFTNFIWEKI